MSHLMSDGRPCARRDGHTGAHSSREALDTRRETDRKWKEAHPDYQKQHKIQKRKRDWQRNAKSEHYSRVALAAAKYRSARDGIPFSITISDMPPLTDNCPKCGVAYEPGRKIARSLDKVLPSLGYVPGNLMWLCSRCNRQKDNMTINDFRSWAVFLEDLLKEVSAK